MDRKAFLGSLAAGGIGLPLAMTTGGWKGSRIASSPDGESVGGKGDHPYSWQRLHPDMQTNPRGVEYFFLGNGLITVALQYAQGEALDLGLTPLGLLIWDPAQFSRKWSTYLFHPEWGLKREMISVRAGETSYTPDPAGLKVRRSNEAGYPQIIATWPAGPHTVEERFWVAAEEPVLFREVSVHNGGITPVPVALSGALYYNHALFTDFLSDTDAACLRARGYGHIELFTQPRAELNDRFLSVDAGKAGPGSPASARMIYVISKSKEEITPLNPGRQRTAAKRRWDHLTEVVTPVEGYNRLYQAGRDNIHAIVAASGRFDAAVWEYNMEWTIDASMVTLGAIHSGQFEVAEALLDNIVTRLSNEQGIMAHASRFRDNMETELNQQGAILGALWTYRAWTGDTDLIRRHWPRIRKIADFPLSPRYLHPSGLLQSEIEFFERGSSMGILPGFGISHQSFVAWGLEKVALLADEMGDAASARRWRQAGQKMHQAMLHHPRFALVDKDTIIKRRLLDGSRQLALRPKEVGTDNLPTDAPLASGKRAYIDPDISLLFPIVLGQLDPGSSLAQNTVRTMGELWSPVNGGYYRYNPASEPEEPGSWTFPTLIVAKALAETGDMAGVQRVLDWLLSVQGAQGGAFFEFYAEAPRPVPPLPPLGIIPWGWGEIANLFVGYLLGARTDTRGDRLLIKPHLPPNCDHITGRLRFRTHQLTVAIRRTGSRTGTLGGRSLPWTPAGFQLPADPGDGEVTITI